MSFRRAALGRWPVGTGYPREGVEIHWRPIGGQLAQFAGFSRPESWLDEAR